MNGKLDVLKKERTSSAQDINIHYRQYLHGKLNKRATKVSRIPIPNTGHVSAAPDTSSTSTATHYSGIAAESSKSIQYSGSKSKIPRLSALSHSSSAPKLGNVNQNSATHVSNHSDKTLLNGFNSYLKNNHNTLKNTTITRHKTGEKLKTPTQYFSPKPSVENVGFCHNTRSNPTSQKYDYGDQSKYDNFNYQKSTKENDGRTFNSVTSIYKNNSSRSQIKTVSDYIKAVQSQQSQNEQEVQEKLTSKVYELGPSHGSTNISQEDGTQLIKGPTQGIRRSNKRYTNTNQYEKNKAQIISSLSNSLFQDEVIDEACSPERFIHHLSDVDSLGLKQFNKGINNKERSDQVQKTDKLARHTNGASEDSRDVQRCLNTSQPSWRDSSSSKTHKRFSKNKETSGKSGYSSVSSTKTDYTDQALSFFSARSHVSDAEGEDTKHSHIRPNVTGLFHNRESAVSKSSSSTEFILKEIEEDLLRSSGNEYEESGFSDSKDNSKSVEAISDRLKPPLFPTSESTECEAKEQSKEMEIISKQSNVSNLKSLVKKIGSYLQLGEEKEERTILMKEVKQYLEQEEQEDNVAQASTEKLDRALAQTGRGEKELQCSAIEHVRTVAQVGRGKPEEQYGEKEGLFGSAKQDGIQQAKVEKQSESVAQTQNAKQSVVASEKYDVKKKKEVLQEIISHTNSEKHLRKQSASNDAKSPQTHIHNDSKQVTKVQKKNRSSKENLSASAPSAESKVSRKYSTHASTDTPAQDQKQIACEDQIDTYTNGKTDDIGLGEGDIPTNTGIVARVAEKFQNCVIIKNKRYSKESLDSKTYSKDDKTTKTWHKASVQTSQYSPRDRNINNNPSDNESKLSSLSELAMANEPAINQDKPLSMVGQRDMANEPTILHDKPQSKVRQREMANEPTILNDKPQSMVLQRAAFFNSMLSQAKKDKRFGLFKQLNSSDVVRKYPLWESEGKATEHCEDGVKDIIDESLKKRDSSICKTSNHFQSARAKVEKESWSEDTSRAVFPSVNEQSVRANCSVKRTPPIKEAKLDFTGNASDSYRSKEQQKVTGPLPSRWFSDKSSTECSPERKGEQKTGLVSVDSSGEATQVEMMSDNQVKVECNEAGLKRPVSSEPTQISPRKKHLKFGTQVLPAEADTTKVQKHWSPLAQTISSSPMCTKESPVVLKPIPQAEPDNNPVNNQYPQSIFDKWKTWERQNVEADQRTNQKIFIPKQYWPATIKELNVPVKPSLLKSTDKSKVGSSDIKQNCDMHSDSKVNEKEEMGPWKPEKSNRKTGPEKNTLSEDSNNAPNGDNIDSCYKNLLREKSMVNWLNTVEPLELDYLLDCEDLCCTQSYPDVMRQEIKPVLNYQISKKAKCSVLQSREGDTRLVRTRKYQDRKQLEKGMKTGEKATSHPLIREEVLNADEFGGESETDSDESAIFGVHRNPKRKSQFHDKVKSNGEITPNYEIGKRLDITVLEKEEYSGDLSEEEKGKYRLEVHESSDEDDTINRNLINNNSNIRIPSSQDHGELSGSVAESDDFRIVGTPVDRTQRRPLPVDTTQRRPSPVDTTQRRPSPVDTMQRTPSPVDTMQRRPSPVDTMQRRPSPVDTMQRKPSLVDRMQRRVSPVDKMQRRVSPRTSAHQIIHGHQPTDSFHSQRTTSLQSVVVQSEDEEFGIDISHDPLRITPSLIQRSREVLKSSVLYGLGLIAVFLVLLAVLHFALVFLAGDTAEPPMNISSDFDYLMVNAWCSLFSCKEYI